MEYVETVMDGFVRKLRGCHSFVLSPQVPKIGKLEKILMKSYFREKNLRPDFSVYTCFSLQNEHLVIG